ncbi:MAG: hypothetical protein B0W54_11385 [Cellvibrio sp. 79]|nr:MAG: hypothetical protein B0W54_11385 [Cellvibrio sp. 79]
MTINTISQFLFNVFVAAGLVATLTACGGGGGNGKDQNAASSSRASFLMGGAIQQFPLNIATVVSTFAGAPGVSSSGSADGIGAAASFNRPDGITTDGTNLYVADTWNNTIRKIVISTGAVTTLAGSAEGSSWGSSDGIGAAAKFNDPTAITTDGTNLYIADSRSYTIRKIVIATGAVTTLAGAAGVSGTADGTGAEARFSRFYGITTDGTNLYVADSNNYTIRKIVIATGAVTTLAGMTEVRGSADGIGTAAIFYFPQGITTDGTNLFVADAGGIRKVVIATGAVTTLANTEGFYNGITTDGTNLYATYDNTIRKIVIATGIVTTLAGTAGFSGSADGVGAAASFASPYSITTDGFELFVTDSFNNTIRKIH